MIDLKLNENGDIFLDSKGNLELIKTKQEAVRQRLSIKLKTFQGEWFLDTLFGIPYRQQIIGKKLSKKEIDAIYISAIKEDNDVEKIVSFNSVYSGDIRNYSLDFEVKVNNQTYLASNLIPRPDQEIEYPPENTSALTSPCGDEFMLLTIKLHPIVHNDMPYGGSLTWIWP